MPTRTSKALLYMFSADIQKTEVVAKEEREGENLRSRVASCLLGCLLTFQNYQKYEGGGNILM